MNGLDLATDKFRTRVITAAEAALKARGAVGPLELFEYMGLLQSCHIDGWRKGNEHYPVLEEWIQVGPEKFEKALRYFSEWVKARGLRPIQASYTRRTPAGIEQLKVTDNQDPEWEKFYHVHYVTAELSEPKLQRLKEKLTKPPDLVVFQKVSEEGNCSECGAELVKGSFLFMEKGKPLCLECADLEHLIFLPAGDTALSRRARKYSPLSAIVVSFSRSRKRYERQGLLVTHTALQKAEEECAADAPERAFRRQLAVVHRRADDIRLVESFAQAILLEFPGCPPAEGQSIAEHTVVRSSGRVGRSAAGRSLEVDAIRCAVIAHIRHEHTNYDELLMKGVARREARSRVWNKIESVLAGWQNP